RSGTPTRTNRTTPITAAPWTAAMPRRKDSGSLSDLVASFLHVGLAGVEPADALRTRTLDVVDTLVRAAAPHNRVALAEPVRIRLRDILGKPGAGGPVAGGPRRAGQRSPHHARRN